MKLLKKLSVQQKNTVVELPKCIHNSCFMCELFDNPKDDCWYLCYAECYDMNKHRLYKKK